ncbi:restriction endonuclease subunit S [Phaeocystidibacter luteus]|uniref:Type I restriction modification DNA specificity domain-containing protein n=1 Tax=Phaeocystidibacter luteus TaxID=911197 RepID=A0A6N6RI90_9FLAO|nr:restriction endonuclease subunit S [Phaeocystidibacter luteus]KAB2810007.1 hypothetical protein F8C67_09000 [Phaeocystidibacter luteus]
MKRYPSYQSTNGIIEVEFPESWQKSRLRFIGNLYGGLTGKAGNDFNDLGHPNNRSFIPFTNVFKNTYINTDDLQFVKIQEGERQNEVRKGDLFFLMSSEGREDLGKCSLLNDDLNSVYLNSFCKGFRVSRDDFDPKYLNYLLFGDIHRNLISIEGRGFTRINLRQESLLNALILKPSIEEQTQIARYLDYKTAKIDALIEKKQRLIDLLEEERTAIINQAVTKGLNPNVPMKDSGIEWLGEIPEHWEIMRISLISNYLSYGFTNPMPTTSQGPYMLTANDIKDGFIDYENARRTEQDAYDNLLTKKSKPFLKDILITKDGTLGRVAICDREDVCINQSVAVIRVDPDKLIPDLLLHFLRASYYQTKMEFDAGGTTIKHIYITRLAKMKVAFPIEKKEQERLLFAIEERIKSHDKKLSAIRREVELLQEYRTALISEVVTGKVDVRDEVIPE